MVVGGTLYTYAGSFRAAKAQIAAGYSGAPVSVDEAFEFGKTNQSDAFLKKFPLGKVPAFESSNGDLLFEADAIAQFVADDQLRGVSTLDRALVQQYIAFANNEITPSACTWTFPCLGFRQFNKTDTEAAKAHLRKCFEMLDNFLLTRTFLVGERVSLADISLVCELVILFKLVLDPAFRAPYGNLVRWFETCVNQPQFTAVLGEVALCETMAQFDSKKYQELHPKKGKEAKKEQAKPKEKKEEKPVVVEEPKPEKKVNPFAEMAPTNFVFDDWKKQFQNETADVYVPWLWENYDPNGISIWRGTYNYNDENKLGWMTANLINGMYDRLEGCRKQLFGITTLMKNNPKNYIEIECMFIMRGTGLIFEIDDGWARDSESYSWTKLDHTNGEDKLYIENTLKKEFTIPADKALEDWFKFV